MRGLLAALLLLPVRRGAGGARGQGAGDARGGVLHGWVLIYMCIVCSHRYHIYVCVYHASNKTKRVGRRGGCGVGYLYMCGIQSTNRPLS